MTYEISIDREQNIVRAEAAGVMNLQTRKEMLRSIHESLLATDFSRVIIDLRETKFNPDEPVSGAFELIDYMKSIGLSQSAKFAFIHSSKEYPRSAFEQFATIAGFNIKYFLETAEGIKWLKESA